MKTTVLATCAMFTVLSAASSLAATIIVDNNPNHAADHRTLQAAVDAAAAGDTILLGPSYAGSSYGNAVINKKLFIYGIGYTINNIDSPIDSNNSSTIVDSIGLYGIKGTSACSGSIISGLKTGSISIFAGEYPSNIDNITIDRVFVGDITIANDQGIPDDQTMQNILSNILISRSIVSSIVNILSRGSVFMRNNIINNISCQLGELLAVNNSSFTYDSSSVNFGNACSGEAYNNIIYKYVKDETSSFNMHHNYLANQDIAVEVVQSQIYAWNSVTDAKYQLKSDSPAKGACQNGADCGAFAGATPYILSGLPPRPRITTLEVPASVLKTDATMQVKVSAESRN